MLDIVVLISGTGSNLRALLAADSNFKVVAVIADRPASGLEYAAQYGVESSIIEPKNYADRSAWAAALGTKIKSYGVSSSQGLIVSAGFMRILPPEFVAAFSPRIINTHPSLLPLYPGANAVAQTLAADARVSGVTVHQIDAGVDTGRQLAQAQVPVVTGDTVDTLHARIKAAEQPLLVQTVSDIAAGRLQLL